MSQVARNRKTAREAASRHGINPSFFIRQMNQEAGFKDLTSPAGAQGPAQIMPATARGWGIKNVHDPVEAYDAAARNMAKYLKSYGGSWSKALTAYNAGPGRVGQALPSETKNYIHTILGGRSDASNGVIRDAPGRFSAGTAPTMQPGGESTDAKGAMLAALLDPHKHSSLLERYQAQIKTGNYTSTTAPSVTPGKSPRFQPGSPGASGGSSRGLAAKASAIDARHLPYKWGGGHGDGGGGPLDCSGAVSKLLGINPRVASQFKTWGKPGRGKDFTIYAKDSHVLVEIGGHFWGTSASNPGGGAGWIPRSKISASYLSGFTARH